MKIAWVGVWISNRQLKSVFKILHRNKLLQMLHIRCCGTVKIQSIDTAVWNILCFYVCFLAVWPGVSSG